MNLITKLHQDFPLYLDDDAVRDLVTWEDWVTTYLQLNEANNSVSWLKADFLSKLYEKFGGGSLEKFASDVGEPRSTVANYVRTSQAFPPKARIHHVSFTHHYQASFSDSYDESKKEFATDTRFKVVEDAADRKISTRQLKDEILEAKDRPQQKAVTCDLCKKDTEEYQKYVFFAPGTGGKADKYTLHKKCYEEIREFIKKYK